MANVAKDLMPVLARSSGRWTGIYRHVSPAGELLDEHRVDTWSTFPEDGSCDFRLEAHNRWADERESRIVLEADYKDGRLVWKGDRLTGEMWEVDDQTIYLRFAYTDDPGLLVCEMIQASRDGQSRARTWHWFRDDRLVRITLTEEQRA